MNISNVVLLGYAENLSSFEEHHIKKVFLGNLHSQHQYPEVRSRQNDQSFPLAFRFHFFFMFSKLPSQV